MLWQPFEFILSIPKIIIKQTHRQTTMINLSLNRTECDPRVVNDYWLMYNGRPYKLLFISLIYLLAIYFGIKWMNRRKPFEIRWPMFIFNVSLVTINLYFFHQSFWWIDYGNELFNVHFPSTLDRSVRAMRIIQLYYHYQISKFIDYFDTIFLVLRKKNDHITVLHVYHHFTVPIVGWISNCINPMMPALGLFAMLNSFCHILMYSYYSLTLLFKDRFRIYLQWKRYITIVQIIQFIVLATYGLYLNHRHNNYPVAFRYLILSQSICYLLLFANFYKRSFQSINHHRM